MHLDIGVIRKEVVGDKEVVGEKEVVKVIHWGTYVRTSLLSNICSILCSESLVN